MSLEDQIPTQFDDLTNEELNERFRNCWIAYANEQTPATLRMCRILGAEIEYRQGEGTWTKEQSPVPDHP